MKNNLIDRMILNSDYPSDKEFNSKLKFVVEKYIYDEIPEQIKCNNLHDMIIKAYKLFLNDELHSIGIYDYKKNYMGTNALNYFIPVEAEDNCKEIENLKNELNTYKEFIKKYNCKKVFQEFKENNEI